MVVVGWGGTSTTQPQACWGHIYPLYTSLSQPAPFGKNGKWNNNDLEKVLPVFLLEIQHACYPMHVFKAARARLFCWNVDKYNVGSKTYQRFFSKNIKSNLTKWSRVNNCFLTTLRNVFPYHVRGTTFCNVEKNTLRMLFWKNHATKKKPWIDVVRKTTSHTGKTRAVRALGV